jgi:hypothetical protein
MDANVYMATCHLGRGLFAKRAFLRGEEIFVLKGTVINFKQAQAKGDAEANPVQIGDDEYLDVLPPGMYLNHSCNPNAGIIHDRVLIALRDIAADEEVCIDYSTTMEENSWTMACRCDDVDCRGIITDFRLIPEEMQRKYLALGIVQGFIHRRYELARD